MKAFHFSLEAVRTLRLRQENDAMEQYARALTARQMAIDALDEVRERINTHWNEMRRRLSEGATAGVVRQLQEFQRTLERRQEECVAALRTLERVVHAASQGMVRARQRREIVDAYRDKQLLRHQREGAREEQKLLDEFAARRVTSLNAAFNPAES